ncbi:urea ABC transporter permease subunit UrtB [Modicisalibacter radicis]|uniref:urea ABC transporter permease subunit UrtB n=1 Tax=Halomonas sp. EAR18 TaxID=2518972 RepID=UPI00109CA2EA|nr:urea ABC transporter permease subunit UrtB [Halomonas sp. EAR18]
MNLLRTLEVSLLFWCCVALTFPVLAQQTDSAEQDAPPELVALAADSYADKGEAIQALIASGHPRTRTWLTALLDGKLQRLEDSGRFVIVTDNSGRDWTVIDAVDDAPLGEVSRRNIDRITINNALRNQLRSAMAVLDLDAPTVQERLVSADRLLGKVDGNLVGPLAARLDAEENPAVREKLAQALAIHRLQSGDGAAVNAAIDTLSGSLNPAMRAALNGVAAGEGEAAEAARRALASIEQKLKLNRAAETLYFGLSLGSVLVLAAIGLAITFGVMGVINMAHGELIMLGAYTTWMMQQLLPGQPGLALILSIPAGFLVAAIAGIIIERSVIRFLKGRPLETLLATFGVSLILQQLVRTLISPLNRTVVTPEWMSGSLVINEALSLTLNRLYVLGFALVVFAGLMLVMRRTRLGLEVRAVTQNRAMARAMGIRATRVDIMTFALGSGVAGLAGVALSQLTNVGPNLGQSYIIDSFMVVVFGGVGNLWGTLVAGMSLGVINQVLEPWAGAILAKIIVLVFIILFIQKRPRGLFPQKGRAAEG